MMGYSATQKGYLLLDYHTNKFFVNRNVIFLEHIFPFAKKKSLDNYSTDFIILYIEEDDELTPSHEVEDDDIDSNIVLEDNAYLDTSPLSTPEASTHDRIVPTSHSAAQPVEESVETHSAVPPRRTSSRVSQQPVWMRDYAAPGKGKGTRYPLANYLSYDNTTSNYQCYLTKFSTLVEPQHFGQAVKDERWMQAMKLEIQALEDNNTWEIVDLPPRKNAIGSKWVYKIKYKANGELERFKLTTTLLKAGFMQST
ncbi:hypothetical protein KY290_011873 [Solanum tuberosum]|uniref:Retroviral polymerase SH3-like domain-containing protein n=1 Tax=Solanum tuberosum TaxID=4113 RepID=A0ABQ7W358_SOLTU|nr:hypothetical protein KY289_012355 [Solanum tuberosum]KAH0710540.1 hypothetical protein KY284_011967 [Solanum tuberosum]KAH0774736.1 hypothetical protein KY290_011873 [Solanum tuberosum]